MMADDRLREEKMIVVGYSADPYGRAALEHGIEEAKLRGTTLKVINSTTGDAYAESPIRPVRRGPRRRETPRGLRSEVRVVPACRGRHRRGAADGDGRSRRRAAGDRNPATATRWESCCSAAFSQQLLLECPKPVLAVKPDSV